MKLELTRGKRKPSFMENDVLWNGIGSMTYALASMVLAFFVLRLGGEEQGGVFGFGYSTLGQQFFIIAYFGLRPFQITDMKGEFSFREYRQFRYITGGLALVFAFVFLFFQYAMGFYSGEKSVILFFLCLFKIMDAYCDVYESELQRRGFLHKGGQSMFLRTLFSVFLLLLVLAFSKNLFLAVVSMNVAQGLSFIFFSLSLEVNSILSKNTFTSELSILDICDLKLFKFPPIRTSNKIAFFDDSNKSLNFIY